MRALLTGLALVALAACDSGSVPSPAQRQAGATIVEEIDEGQIAVHGEGLVVGVESFFFAAGRTEVDTALTGVLGEPAESLDNPECGAGPMQFSVYPGGLTVNFQDERLVGWLLRGGGDFDESTLAVDSDAAIGMDAEALAAVPGYFAIEGSTLGEEFAIGDTLGGFVEDGAVTMLYAGTQCFFR